MTAMRDRRNFERDANRALRTAACARRHARTLARHASRGDRLAAGFALAEAIRALRTLRDETAVKLETVRRHGRSHRAYAQIVSIGADGRGVKP